MLIAALGASAGGLSALTEFFVHVPVNTPIAYVVLLELPDEYQRRLEDALSVSVPIPVVAVRERTRIEPNKIYLIPPHQGVSFLEDHPALIGLAGAGRPRAPVDAFFRALAKAHGSRAVCIVLSGIGTSGSKSLRQVKERGGLCLAQDPHEAEYSEMPRSAIASGMVERVMPVAAMPGHIVAQTERLSAIPVAGSPHGRVSPDERAAHPQFAWQFALPSVVVNERHDIVHLSERARRYLQFKEGDAVRNLLDVSGPELGPDLRAALERAERQRREVETRGIRVHAEGRAALINLIVRPLVLEDDPARGLFVVLFEDIAEGITSTAPQPTSREGQDVGQGWRAADHELSRLRASQSRLAWMIESATDCAILTIGVEGRVESWNTGASRMFGYAREEAIGELADVLFVEDDTRHGIVADVMLRARREGRAVDERWQVRKDGSRIYVYGIVTPLRDNSGAFVGCLEIAYDLTARKQQEDAMQLMLDDLKETVEATTRNLLDADHRLEQERSGRREAEGRIRDLVTRLATLQEDERRRIQRDLHDQIGQQISALRLKLEALSLAGADRQLHAWIEETRVIVEDLDHDLDVLTWELGPSTLHEVGLAPTLRNVVQTWSTNCGIAAECRATGFDERRLSFDIETHLYRIAQEALNNVFKHARATHVSVTLERGDHDVALIVVDNGRGIERARELGSGGRVHELGLTGMRERAALVGGTLEIESPPGRGTTVVVRVPLMAGPPTRRVGR